MARFTTDSPARYDAIAEWYDGWTDGWSSGFVCDPGLELVSSSLRSERWLDIACGTGRTSRELARRGGTVTGVDLAAQMVAVAKAEEAARPLGITYRIGDVSRPDDWWDGKPFDGAVCEMALMDIDDLAGTLEAVAEVLRFGSPLVVSLVHPCCPETASGLSSWPPSAGYQAEGFWTSKNHNPEGVRARVGSNHRMLSTYLNCFIHAGFRLDEVREPPAAVPMWLLLAFSRAGGAEASG